MRSQQVLLVIVLVAVATSSHAQVDYSGDPWQYYIGGQPWSLFCADLNGDGHPDLATVSYQTDSLSILLNAGDGTHSLYGRHSTGDVPVYVHGACIDADTDIDLAVANKLDGTVSIFFNNGDATFAAPVTLAVGYAPTSVRLADLNNDDHADLVVTNEQITMPFIGDSISVLFNNGDGTFQTRVSFEVGDEPQESVAIDLNGDHSPDLAVVNLASHSISVLLNDGNSSFAPAAECESHHMPSGVSAADLDNDGDQDLVAPNSDASERSVFSVVLNNGDGTFQPTIYYNSGGAPIATFVSDLDRDDDIDIVVANWTSDSVSILLNNGDATFQPPLQYRAGDGPSSVFTADLNDDDYSDLAVTNRNSHDLFVYLNQGASSDLGENRPSTLPVRFELAQNYPNPFNAVTTIEFSIPCRSLVSVDVHNVLGQKILTLVNQTVSPGSYSAVWDANPFASGVYFLRLVAGEYQQTRKMILQK